MTCSFENNTICTCRTATYLLIPLPAIVVYSLFCQPHGIRTELESEYRHTLLTGRAERMPLGWQYQEHSAESTEQTNFSIRIRIGDKDWLESWDDQSMQASHTRGRLSYSTSTIILTLHDNPCYLGLPYRWGLVHCITTVCLQSHACLASTNMNTWKTAKSSPRSSTMKYLPWHDSQRIWSAHQADTPAGNDALATSSGKSSVESHFEGQGEFHQLILKKGKRDERET